MMNIDYKDGAWILSTIVNNRRITMRYEFYTRIEAVKRFKAYIAQTVQHGVME